MNFSEKLKTLRKQFKFSQEQLAEKIGVSRQAITKWETDGGLPDIENLMAIAALFSVSLDDLLAEEKTVKSAKDFSYESVTELDINGGHDFDIHACGVREALVSMTEDEKIRIRLASNVLKNLQSDYKVQIDEHKSRLDVNIRRVGGVSKTESKDALYLSIELPRQLCDEAELAVNTDTLRICGLSAPLEFDGKVSRVILEDTTGTVALNSNLDMDITCDKLPSALEVNQLSAASTLHIPKNEPFYTKIKGKTNNIRYAVQGKPSDAFDSPEADNRVELAGMNAELLIDAAERKADEFI